LKQVLEDYPAGLVIMHSLTPLCHRFKAYSWYVKWYSKCL